MNHHSPLCGARNGIQGFLYVRQTYNRLSSIPSPRKFVFIITSYFLDFFKEPLLAFIKDYAYLTYYMSSLFTRCWLLLLSKFVLFFFSFSGVVYMCVCAHMWYACICTHVYDVHECVLTCVWHAYISNMWMHTCMHMYMDTWSWLWEFLISLHLIHWGKVSELNSELTDVASLTSWFAPGIPCLRILSAGTGSKPSCPPGTYIGSGSRKSSCPCLCDKHISHWTIPSPNICF